MAAIFLCFYYAMFLKEIYGEIKPPQELDAIMKELSWVTKLKLLNEYSRDVNAPLHYRRTPNNNRRNLKAVQAMAAHNLDQENKNVGDDDSMKMKLFRLMYETVSDSDLKVKRAELIRGHYTNDTIFEIGYLMGDVIDKYNVMTDIAATVKRLYEEWKPIEHINAYEQIANQAIEVGHVIDIMRSVYKKSGEKTDQLKFK